MAVGAGTRGQVVCLQGDFTRERVGDSGTRELRTEDDKESGTSSSSTRAHGDIIIRNNNNNNKGQCLLLAAQIGVCNAAEKKKKKKRVGCEVDRGQGNGMGSRQKIKRSKEFGLVPRRFFRCCTDREDDGTSSWAMAAPAFRLFCTAGGNMSCHAVEKWKSGSS